MKTLTPDALLGWRTLDHIEGHLSEWDQRIYCKRTMCGTTACFAGWSLLLSGITPDDLTVRTSTLPQTAMVLLPTGFLRDVGIWDAAKAVLRLTDFQAVRLFRSDNTLGDLQAAVRAVFGPRPAADVPFDPDVLGRLVHAHDRSRGRACGAVAGITADPLSPRITCQRCVALAAEGRVAR